MVVTSPSRASNHIIGFQAALGLGTCDMKVVCTQDLGELIACAGRLVRLAAPLFPKTQRRGGRDEKRPWSLNTPHTGTLLLRHFDQLYGAVFFLTGLCLSYSKAEGCVYTFIQAFGYF